MTLHNTQAFSSVNSKVCVVTNGARLASCGVPCRASFSNPEQPHGSLLSMRPDRGVKRCSCLCKYDYYLRPLMPSSEEQSKRAFLGTVGAGRAHKGLRVCRSQRRLPVLVTRPIFFFFFSPSSLSLQLRLRI